MLEFGEKVWIDDVSVLFRAIGSAEGVAENVGDYSLGQRLVVSW